jgi:hypothetical protein
MGNVEKGEERKVYDVRNKNKNMENVYDYERKVRKVKELKEVKRERISAVEMEQNYGRSVV